MICPRCQAENNEEARYCQQCGIVLAGACPNCHNPIAAAAGFCGFCGIALHFFCRFCGAAMALEHLYCTRCGRQQVDTMPPAAPQRTSSAPPPSPTSLPSPPAQPAAARPAATTQAAVQELLPQELATKLEEVRARGSIQGERRVVTMLFCDVKGSTAAAEQLDPEEWSEIINGAFEQMIKPVYTYEGTVARLMGDSILAFFGAPLAHEDDPERAVLAALAIVAGIELFREQVKSRWQVDFDVRVGINTGLVVVGEMGSDLHMEYTALGDAINLAARMEQTAMPGTVQIAHDTYKLVKTLFDVEELGEITVKGKDEPVPAYRVIGRKAQAGRKRGIEGLQAKVVGRDLEVATLRQLMAGVQQGVGRIVCVIGEAGLGKSRLLGEMKQMLNSAQPAGDFQPLHWFEEAALSYETAQPYAFFRRLLRRLYDIAPSDSVREVREKLNVLFAQHESGEQQRIMRVFATLFDLSESDDLPRLEGETFKQELFHVMQILWRQRFDRQPALLLLDDMHWSDPASIELLIYLLPLTSTIPLVLLCAFRPDRESPVWRLKTTSAGEYAHGYTEIVLRPLSNVQVDELIDDLLSIADLPQDLRTRIQERAAGNPLFVEEVVRSLMDSGSVVAEEQMEEGQRRRYWRAAGAAKQIDIPDNLQSLLAARIDRLQEETRRTLQLASVVGRSFLRRVLEKIDDSHNGTGPGAGAQIDQQLEMLLRLEMIREVARLPELEYQFSNPLLQEVAYQAVLLSRRRQLHRRVGEALESLFPQQQSELAPRLAYHFREAAMPERSLHYDTLAGDSAFRLSANAEAIAYYSSAIESAREVDVTPEQLIHLYTRRARAQELLLLFDEAIATYDALLTLAEERDNDRMRLAVLLARTTLHTTFNPKFDEELGEAYAQQALALARTLDDPQTQSRIMWNLMLVYGFAKVDFEQAVVVGKQALAQAREAGDREQLAYILNDLGRMMGFAGQGRQGLPLMAEAQTLFEQLNNLPMLTDNLTGTSMLTMSIGDLETSLAMGQKAYSISSQIENLVGERNAILRVAAVQTVRGELADAIEALLDLVDKASPNEYALIIEPLFWAYLYLGDREAAATLIDQAEPYIESGGTLLSLLHCGINALVLAELGQLERAEDYLQRFDDQRGRFQKLPLLVSTSPAMAAVKLALAQGRSDDAKSQADDLVAQMRQQDRLLAFPDCLLLQAQANLALDAPQRHEAQTVLEESVALARKLQARPILWQALALLAEVETDAGRSSALLTEAQQVIETIADDAGPGQMRQTFLNRPDVQKIRAASGT